MKKLLFLILGLLPLAQYADGREKEKKPNYRASLRLETFHYFSDMSEEESVKSFVEMYNDTLRTISHTLLINKEGEILLDGNMVSLEEMNAIILSMNHLVDKALLFVLKYQLAYKGNIVYRDALEAIYKIKDIRGEFLKEKYPSMGKEELFKNYPTLLADTDISFGQQVLTNLSKPLSPPLPPLDSSIKFVAPVILKEDEISNADEMKSQEELSDSKVTRSVEDVKSNDEIHESDLNDAKQIIAEAPQQMEKKTIYKTTVPLPRFTWPPRSYPLNIPYIVSKEVRYYWGIQRITCIGRATKGYKFRISGTANHDFNSDKSIDLDYITPNNQLKIAGAYYFPKIQKGQKFSFEIVSAITGYTPAKFNGFFIHDEWLSIPEEEEIEPKTDLIAPAVSTNSIDEYEETLGAEEIAERTDEPKVDTVVKTLPQFPEGMPALTGFLARNIIYPAIAVESRIQGRVLVEVTIDENGSVTAPKIINSVAPSLDKGALRVVKLLPKFAPGKQNNTPVKVQYTSPVNFKLL